MLIIYDCKQACEPKTAPHRRTAPLQLARMKRVIAAVMEARTQAAGLDRKAIVPGDLFVLFDGGKEGNHAKMRSAFSADDGTAIKPRSNRALQLIYNEESVAERRGYCSRGAASIKQSERCLLVTQHKPVMPTKKRKHFTGTNRGDSIVGIPCLLPEAMWHLPFAQKRELLGTFRVDVGGPTGSDGEEEDDDGEDKEEDEPAAKAGGGGMSNRRDY